MLGSLILVRWYERQNPSSHRGWCLSSACGASSVCILLWCSFLLSFSVVFFWFELLKYASYSQCFICSHPSPSVLIPALRTVGNIVTGDDLQTQVCSVSKSLAYVLSITLFDGRYAVILVDDCHVSCLIFSRNGPGFWSPMHMLQCIILLGR